MNITCIAAQVMSQEGTAGTILASVILDGLVTLNDIVVVLGESSGFAEIRLPPAPTGPALSFQTPFARTAFTALLAKAVAEFASNLTMATKVREQLATMQQTVTDLTGAINKNTAEILRRMPAEGMKQ
jgi:hypothetical protein